jgi:hypothetical protein
MTEAEWLACTDPKKILKRLQGRSSDRKLRLLACACCRAIWCYLTAPRSRGAIEVAERYADGLATDAELERAHVLACHAAQQTQGRGGGRRFDRPLLPAEAKGLYAAQTADPHTPFLRGGLAWVGWDPEVQSTSPALLRELFGPLPFRPVPLDPAWLSWRRGTIPKLAQAIYEERDLPSGHLDHHRLAVLADALEDAGCDNADILSHCRSAGPHVRGCWVVDLLLGKE